jgi:mRNA interferase MazF
MARFVVGDVVIVPSSFADFSESKRCPALVLAVLAGDDFMPNHQSECQR